MDKNNYFFDKKESIIDPTGVELFKFYNFISKINDNPVIHKSGKFFAIKYGTQYGHLLLHFLGPYLYLKKRIPDLQLIFLKFEHSPYYLNTYAPYEDLSKILNAEIIDVNKDNFLFDEFMFFYFDDFDITVFPMLEQQDPNAKSPFPIIPSKLFLENFYALDPKSKELENIETEGLIALFETFKEYRIDKDENNYIYIKRPSDNNKPGPIGQSTWYKNIRSIDELYIDFMENKIKNLGYQIIDLNGMGFLEQINIFYNAKSIATIDGTSVLNSIWCKPSAKIFRIMINKIYKQTEYPWSRMINSYEQHDIEIIDVTEKNPIDGVNLIVSKL